MQVKILARNPTDQFTFDFFEQCVKQLPEDSDAFYIWAEPFELFESMIKSLDIRSKNVLLCISDNLSLYDFNPWTDTHTYGTRVLKELFNQHVDKKFILITDVVNLNEELSDTKNLQIVSLEYLTMQATEWCQVPAILEKNLNSNKAFISLNHRPAAHRITALSYMLTTGLDTYGTVLASSDFIKHVSHYDSYLDIISWEFNELQEKTLRPILLSGFQKIKQFHCINNDYDLKSHNRFANNYTQYLTPYYKNSFVEIVAETYYAEPSFMVTEKTLNAVYGCNFPIYVSAAGTVQHLENLGFDMFRDVVNHNYDLITNPFDRICALFDQNQKLLTDSNYAKSCWTKNAARFEQNVNFARKEMYSLIHSRAVEKFSQAISTTCK